MSGLMQRLLLPAVLFATIIVSGCASYDDYPDGGPYVDRGYYFYPDYYDNGGHYHARDYWYYDGHSYAHRDALPHGETAHLRMDSIHGGTHAGASGSGAFHGGDGGHSGGEGGGDGGHFGGEGGGGHGR